MKTVHLYKYINIDINIPIQPSKITPTQTQSVYYVCLYFISWVALSHQTLSPPILTHRTNKYMRTYFVPFIFFMFYCIRLMVSLLNNFIRYNIRFDFILCHAEC